MFEHLRRYPKIVVTGPPRSGTRIASRIIANDTGHRYVDEAEHDHGFNEPKWRTLISQGTNIVVQSPGSRLKDCIDNPPAGVFLVLVRRSVADIHASQRRVRKMHDDEFYAVYRGSAMFHDSVEGAYLYWDDHSKTVPYMEVSYESLAEHPLWLAADKRADFWLNQTTEGS